MSPYSAQGPKTRHRPQVPRGHDLLRPSVTLNGCLPSPSNCLPGVVRMSDVGFCSRGVHAGTRTRPAHDAGTLVFCPWLYLVGVMSSLTTVPDILRRGRLSPYKPRTRSTASPEPLLFRFLAWPAESSPKEGQTSQFRRRRRCLFPDFVVARLCSPCKITILPASRTWLPDAARARRTVPRYSQVCFQLGLPINQVPTSTSSNTVVRFQVAWRPSASLFLQIAGRTSYGGCLNE